ncbi:MAG: outer membrane lipoprotein carrier protein LolA [Phycisphaerae bacterium]
MTSVTMRRVFLFGATICFAVSTMADDLADVEKKIHEKAKSIKSVQAKVKTVTDMSMEGYKMQGESIGEYQMMKNAAGKMMMRMETKDKNKTEVAGQTNETEGTNLMISDGEFTYSLSDINGVKTASKAAQGDWDQMPFTGYREQYTIKQLPDEKVDGAAAWVFEMTPKENVGAMAGSKMVISFHQESGMPIKTVSYNAEGKPQLTMTMTDIKLNDNISADRFVFKAPPGVEVMDYSNMQNQTEWQQNVSEDDDQ